MKSVRRTCSGTMKTFVALLRGINIGGHNLLPMGSLKETLEVLGLKNIRTYIQSGNVVFQSEIRDRAKLARQIGAAIEGSHGLSPKILVLDRREWDEAMAVNPFPEACSDPGSLHVIFLDSVPVHPDLEALEKIREKSERFHLQGKLFFLHAPGGIGRSKLASRIEKSLGVAGTGRNWRSIEAIAAMVRDMDEGN